MKPRIKSSIIKGSSNFTRKGLRIIRIIKPVVIVGKTIRDNYRLDNILK